MSIIHKLIRRLALPRPIGTLRFLAAWLVPWRPAFGVRAANSGLWFFVNHRDAIGRHIAKYGTHEPLLTRWLWDFLEASRQSVVVDIGANLGWHALHAACHHNVDTVIAFEPHPLNAWLLERNRVKNNIDKFILDCRAVGATPGVARLYCYGHSNTGRHSLAVDHGLGSRQVPMTSLDNALNEMGFGSRSIAVIKIDVEGYEPAVIAGARQTLDHTDVVVLEYSPDWSRVGGLSAREMLASLRLRGFTPFAMRNSGGIVRTTFDALEQFTGSLDVIFVRTERIAELARGLNEHQCESLSLQAIAKQNRWVKKPL